MVCCVAALYLLASCATPEARNNATTQPVRLLSPLAFDHFTKTGPITRSQAMGLFNEKVKLDSKDADDYAFLVLPAPPQAISNPAAPLLSAARYSATVSTRTRWPTTGKAGGAAGLLMACGGAGRTRNA